MASKFRTLTMTSATGQAVTVELSGEGGLVDERHYNSSLFRLGHYPVSGDIKAGQTWEYSVRIAVE